MNTRLSIVKTVLWALVGVLAVVTVARLLRGLGASTGLSDAAPWGLWIAFDVMSGVALAAGGFVLAATVYVFGLEEYRPFVRPAILTALLGYLAVAVGLLYDLGLPWHIWHLMIYQQPHSVLFEVGMCVMLYLTVLSLEFLPVVLEYRWFDRPLFRAIHKALYKAVIPLVIAGIVLSTLHQSSLGSLFLITPYRLHPLWYSPIIWVLFFVSAVALGLMMVTAESLFSGWLFNHKIKVDRLAGLGKAAAVVLFVYAGLRLGDMAVRGVIGLAFDGSWQASLFFFELLVSALIPATLLSLRRVRTSIAGLAICAGMVVLGIIGYRFDVCIVAFARPEGMSYFPSWMELAVSLGIVGGAVLVFIFFVENLKVYQDGHAPESDAAPRIDAGLDYGPAGMRSLLPDSLGAPRRYSLAAVIAAAATVAFLPADLLSGTQFASTPVSAARASSGWIRERADGGGYDVLLARPGDETPPGAERVALLSIDGNRDGQAVLFPHDAHIAALGEQDSCGACHHLNMPFDTNSSCFECHRDMYVATDIFDHAFHVAKLAGNDGCADCHRDTTEIKTRDEARACGECHQDMMVAGSTVTPPEGGIHGIAVGYMDAMHGLCIACHEDRVMESPQEYGADFAECARCHRDVASDRLREMRPYADNPLAR
ncbi:MAG: Ni/Fe-hydrogenase cytochrome b subunit [Planctomycetes bacterium]|nr:Ni/Fe-hydrogenase cytochrome b subunit [Planctomycetota bacterium]